MEYTKDIILNLDCKKGANSSKFKICTSKAKKIIKENKIIIIFFIILTTLITADFILISSFLNILEG